MDTYEDGSFERRVRGVRSEVGSDGGTTSAVPPTAQCKECE